MKHLVYIIRTNQAWAVAQEENKTKTHLILKECTELSTLGHWSMRFQLKIPEFCSLFRHEIDLAAAVWFLDKRRREIVREREGEICRPNLSLMFALSMLIDKRSNAACPVCIVHAQYFHL